MLMILKTREDGGTPGFLQAMRAALAIKLKEQMGTENIMAREKELTDKLFSGLSKIMDLKYWPIILAKDWVLFHST